MKVEVGYGLDILAQSTRKYHILYRTTCGKFVVELFTLMQNIDGKPYLACQPLAIKSHLRNIHEEEIDD